MQKTYEDLASLGNANGGLRGDNESRRESNMEMNETLSRERESLKSRMTGLTKRLKSLGVVRVEVDYDGIGDSGDIQDVRALKTAAKKSKEQELVDLSAEKIEVERFESVYDNDAKSWTRRAYKVEVDMKQALDDFTTAFLGFHGIDWYNNEGGYGTVVLSVADGTVKAEHNTRFESSHYSEHEL